MAAEHSNNVEHVINKFVTTTNFMTDECNKFCFYVQRTLYGIIQHQIEYAQS
jgi:hypothetical protein